MKRSPMPQRKKPMAQRSKKQAKVYAGDASTEGRAALVARLLAERPVCQAGLLRAVAAGHQAHVTGRAAVGCTGGSQSVHEILPRSRGGSIFDVQNLAVLCFACHQWVHRNEKQATKLGLLRGRAGKHEGPAGDIEVES